MYAAIWRLLPGPTWLRATQAVLAALVVLVALFTWGFPAVSAVLQPFGTTVTAQ